MIQHEMNTPKFSSQHKACFCKHPRKLAFYKADYDSRHHQWPAIPGLKDFKGHVTHSARWDHDFDYSNKRIAVIGNGSSGIQIVPQMAKLPGTDVMNFIRGPTWVTYRVSPATHLGRPSDEVNPSYLDEEKKRFAEHPTAMRDHRRAIIGRSTKAFRMVSPGLLPSWVCMY